MLCKYCNNVRCLNKKERERKKKCTRGAAHVGVICSKNRKIVPKSRNCASALVVSVPDYGPCYFAVKLVFAATLGTLTSVPLIAKWRELSHDSCPTRTHQ